MWQQAFIQGFLTSAAMIAAIGMQNAYVMTTGTQGRRVFAVALICACCDALLIALGVAGVGALLIAQPGFHQGLLATGFLFLLFYGSLSIWKGWKGDSALQDNDLPSSLLKVLVGATAVTLLNPHAYLDTFVLIGGLAVSFGENSTWFGLGAGSASFVWFTLLSIISLTFAHWLKQPIVWRWLNTLMGLLMLKIAFKVLMQLKAFYL